MPEHYQSRFLRRAPRDGSTMNLKPTGLERLHIDPILLFLLLCINALGLFILYSASERDTAMVMRQVISFGLAYTLMFLIAQIPPKVYQGFAPWFYSIGVILLVLVALVGQVRLGARRWLSFPGVGSVQPSEFLKLGVPMMIAWFLSKQLLPPKFSSVLTTVALIALPALLIARQPDLGTALLVSAAGIFVLFLAGLHWWMIGVLSMLIAAFLPVAWFYLLHDFQKQRIITVFNPEADALGTGWNIIQSKTAIGSGGLLGKGYLQGSQSHLHFLPEGHTDFIIAAYSEENGLFGIALLLLLYTLVIMRALVIAYQVPDNFSRLLAGAIALSFFVYVFVNAGMVSGILPVVGVPLPFVSYGGTAVITLMAGFGILMSIRTHR